MSTYTDALDGTAAPIAPTIARNRWLQLGLGLVCMMAISSPQYVWTLMTKPLAAKLGIALPELQVPEMPEDPADFVSALTAWNLFEVGSFSVEDSERTAFYRANAARQALQQQASDLPAHGRSAIVSKASPLLASSDPWTARSTIRPLSLSGQTGADRRKLKPRQLWRDRSSTEVGIPCWRK